MKDGLYHKETGLPLNKVSFQMGTVPLRYTRHAEEAARTDRYGFIKLPKFVNTDRAEVVEVEVTYGKIDKVVYRANYSEEADIILVIGRGGVVRTVWLNLKSDKHKTLDKSRYIAA